MKKNYVKMNNNDCLSLGNIINIIKRVSNSNNATQLEIFCSIFGINNINTTTVNNYCIGIRAIGLEYKKIFEDNYINNNLDSNVLSILNILNNQIYNDINCIENNIKMKEAIDEMFLLALKDEHIEDINQFKKENNYKTFISFLYYSIIINKQPIYTNQNNIKLNKKELNDYMNIKLYYGQSYILSLIELASKNNIYACAEMGSLEFDGLISGKKDYEKSYYYYLKAADKGHPKACWMIANLIYTKKVNRDLNTMLEYLNKSIELGSAAGYNTLGLCYLNGIGKEKNIEKAIMNFKYSSELGYVFAFNNLGKVYDKINPNESLKYYLISADMGNSWALNKVGEYYRKNNNMEKAFFYYNKSIECPIKERYLYGYYNLAKYYYENGCKSINIKKNSTLAKKYYEIFYNDKLF